MNLCIKLDPECIHAENIGEFYPEAVNAAKAVLDQMLTDPRDLRDSGILAACVASQTLQALPGSHLAKDNG